MNKPDLTRRANYPIFGDTLTWTEEQGAQKKQYTGVICEHNVEGTQVWTVREVSTKNIMYVHGCDIINIERTGEIPECPTSSVRQGDDFVKNKAQRRNRK